MGTCTICKQQIRMIKNNEQVPYVLIFLLVQHMVFSYIIVIYDVMSNKFQAKTHVDNKHSGKSFGDCFPGFS